MANMEKNPDHTARQHRLPCPQSSLALITRPIVHSIHVITRWVQHYALAFILASRLIHLFPTLQGFISSQISCQRFLNLRYDGTDVPLMTLCPPGGNYAAAFMEAYQVWRPVFGALGHLCPWVAGRHVIMCLWLYVFACLKPAWGCTLSRLVAA